MSTTNILDLNNRIDKLSDEVTNSLTIHALTPQRSSITIVSGGYIKLGNMVIVSVTFDSTETISNPNAPIISGLPSADTINNPLLLSADGENVLKTDTSIRVYSTQIYSGTGITANKRYVISGIYYSA